MIDSAYIQSQAINSPESPVSSVNQQVHVFNPQLNDRITWASNQTEAHIFQEGSHIITGFWGNLNASS